MPYSYYGYGDFLANNIYVILLIPVLLLSVWAQAQVSGSFRPIQPRCQPPSSDRRTSGPRRFCAHMVSMMCLCGPAGEI